MRKVIERKLYDTDKAELLHEFESHHMPNDFHYYEEALYVTPKGTFFIAGEGGAMSKYAEAIGNNGYGGSADITPLTMDEAIDWLETHNGADVLAENPHFDDEIEEA